MAIRTTPASGPVASANGFWWTHTSDTASTFGRHFELPDLGPMYDEFGTVDVRPDGIYATRRYLGYGARSDFETMAAAMRWVECLDEGR